MQTIHPPRRHSSTPPGRVRCRRRGFRETILAILIAATGGTSPVADVTTIYDFEDAGSVRDWRAINDGVMGGISEGAVEPTAGDSLIFVGDVSLENNGGFASIRSTPRSWNLAPYDGITLRVRGDGKRYKLNLKTDAALDGVMYRVPFETEAGKWQTLSFPFGAFEPTFRGRSVPGAPALDPAKITSFGVLISDRQSGPFALEIAHLAAYAAPAAQSRPAPAR